ncbi:OstA-like protein [Pelodictyon luteolum]|nr:OstA-like protein [Pelodictyon luteolum]
MTRPGRLLILTASILLLQDAPLPGLHHNTAHAEKKKIILRHADTIEGGEDAGGSFRAAIGNVLFEKDNLTLSCDRTTDYEGQDRIVMNGHVRISDGAKEIFGDDGVFHPSTDVCELHGNVRGRMLDNSMMVRSRKAVFNNQENRLWFYDNAIGWRYNEQVSGDILRIQFKPVDENAPSKDGGGKQKIDEMQVHGHAFYATRDTLTADPEGYDQLSGRHIVVLIGDDSKVKGVTVTKEAESLVHIYDNDGMEKPDGSGKGNSSDKGKGSDDGAKKLSGINYSSGDRIKMIFKEGTLKKMNVTGNAEGTEYPPELRGSVNLPKFKWREDERPFGKQAAGDRTAAGIKTVDKGAEAPERESLP